jgi:tubulin-folding cofactor B
MSASSDYVSVIISSNLTSFEAEKRFPSITTLASLKEKLELLTGGMADSMKIELRDKEHGTIKELHGHDMTLSQLGVQSGMRIHVIDNPSRSLESSDTADAAFNLSPEEYAKREESARNFLMANKLGKYDETKIKKKEEEEEKETRLAQSIVVGSRCEVKIPGQLPRRGAVRHVGPVHFKPGAWVGIQYDEPSGKNDGSVEGKRYFECKPKYGGFVRPTAVTTGDFPEVDELDEI